MKVKDIIRIMEDKIAPVELAESFDSIGLKTGSPDAEVTGVIVCLDVTSDVIDEAVLKKCNMIICHHPVLFKATNEMTEYSYHIVCDAIRHNLNIYSAHTNFDYASGGINDTLAFVSGLTDIKKSGYHRYGHFAKEITLKEITEIIKYKYDLQAVYAIVPKTYVKDKIYIAGISCGAFDGEIEWLREVNADLLITGEIKHSDAMRLYEENFITIVLGHAISEIEGVRALVPELIKEGVNACISESEFNPFVLLK